MLLTVSWKRPLKLNTTYKYWSINNDYDPNNNIEKFSLIGTKKFHGLIVY